MTQTSIRFDGSREVWLLEDALPIAQHYREHLAPSCERIEIAGTLRREKAQVHDIDLVAIARYESKSVDLFGTAIPHSLLEDALAGIGQAKKNGPRLKQILLPEGIYLEIYIVAPPAQWGAMFTLRTGPADFSHWLVTPKRQGGAMPSYLQESGGALWRKSGGMLGTPEEIDFFRALGLEWIEPRDRRAPSGQW